MNFFVGDNAQGKTNLLEAVYFLAHLASFRTRRSQDLVRSGAERLSVEGQVRSESRSRQIRVDLAAGRRKLFLDGLPTTDLPAFLGSLTVLLFSPGQVELLRGSPESRRRFLDRAVMRSHPDHASFLRQYQRLVKTRNRCLKEGDWHLARLYSPKVAQLGGRIVALRLEIMGRLAEHVPKLYRLAVDSEDRVCVAYRSAWLEGELGRRLQEDERGITDRLSVLLEEALLRTESTERVRRYQVVGPQADDMDVSIEGLSAPRHASQGQMRSLLASLVFAEQKILQEDGTDPVLLVDDLSSELDSGRREALVNYLRGLRGQVLITGTDLEALGGLGPGRVFRVDFGRIIPRTEMEKVHDESIDRRGSIAGISPHFKQRKKPAETPRKIRDRLT